MKVLYLGCFCEPTISTFIKECTKGVITVSATTFQKALLAGCNECGIRPDYIVNVPDIGCTIGYRKRISKLCDGYICSTPPFNI